MRTRGLVFGVCLVASVCLTACGSTAPTQSSKGRSPISTQPAACKSGGSGRAVTLGWPPPQAPNVFTWGEGDLCPQAIIDVNGPETGGQTVGNATVNGTTDSAVYITWKSWGGAEAIGHGEQNYDPPSGGNGPCYSNVGCLCGTSCGRGHAIVVAFMPGICYGHRVYRAVEWYFPAKRQSFTPDVSKIPDRGFRTICSKTNRN